MSADVTGVRGAGVNLRPRRALGRWLLLLVALGGLLAMHGLSDHGVGGPAVTAGSMAAVHGDGPTGHHGGIGDDGQGDRQGGDRRDHHGGLVVGMCLAVVVSALLLGVAGPRGVRATLMRRGQDRVRHAAAVAFWARARDPAAPDLATLSILRC